MMSLAAWFRNLLGLRLPPTPRPPSRMTEQDALDAPDKALGGSSMPLVVDDLTTTGGRLIWTVRTASVGSGSIVRIDDADGTVVENAHWGVR